MFSSAENDPAILYQYFIQQVKKKIWDFGKDMFSIHEHLSLFSSIFVEFVSFSEP